MSAFQFYDFRAIDRPLSTAQIAEVEGWSSRSKVGSKKAVFTYAYGDFQKNPLDAVDSYFDGLLYWASWGAKKLIFRFPLSSIDLPALQKFAFEVESADNTYQYGIRIHKRGSNVLLECYAMNEEEEDYVDEMGKEMDHFVQIREAILTEDYRSLFLFWLHLAEFKVKESLTTSLSLTLPMLPSALKTLSVELEAFVDFFGIDRFLIRAAAHFSPDSQAVDRVYGQALAQLDEMEKNEWLLRLASQEPHLDRQFKKRLDFFLEQKNSNGEAVGVHLAEILELAKTKPRKN
jgi:hypothetical protein